ncbi:MAG: peptidoglycan editing factor PgeF [Pseudomonadota bacterium]
MITHPLLTLPMIRHGFFTRTGGVSNGIYQTLNVGSGSHDQPEKVRQNHAICASLLGGNSGDLRTLYQIHSNICVDASQTDTPPRADAHVCDHPGTILGVVTADCAPILFCDPLRKIIGAAHAGWRGAKDGICEATLCAMEKKGSKRDAIVAVIGPCIACPSYAVGEEFYDAFDIATQERHFHKYGMGWHFDLAGFLLDDLRMRGVTQCTWSGEDTYSKADQFFSYRRATHEGVSDYGRQLSAIMIAPS